MCCLQRPGQMVPLMAMGCRSATSSSPLGMQRCPSQLTSSLGAVLLGPSSTCIRQRRTVCHRVAKAASNDAQGSSACRLFRDMPRLTRAGMGGSSGVVRSSARVWAKKQTQHEQADASLHSWVQYLAGCNQHSNTPCTKRQASPRLQLPCRTKQTHTTYLSTRPCTRHCKQHRTACS